MGTSQSSKGSPSGIPMVPPWVPNVGSDDSSGGNDAQNDESQPDQNENQSDQDRNDIAPPSRFGATRRNLNSFSKHGDSSAMKRAVGQYFQRGYGGGKTALKRFGGTISTGGALYSALSSVKSGEAYYGFDPLKLSSNSPQEIVDKLIEVIRPIDGTLDAEASRNAIQTACSELLTKDENIDLLNLSEENCLFITERFVSDDIFRRFELDLGKDIRKNAPTPSAEIGRLREIKSYITQVVSQSFKGIKDTNIKISETNIRSIVRTALEQSIFVFEEYIK